MNNLRAMDIATILNSTMPSIGFFNGAKRIDAYAATCSHAEELADGDTALAMEAITILSFMSKPFHKSAFMAMSNIDRLDASKLGYLGWFLANTLAIRDGLSTHPKFSTDMLFN